MLRGSYVHLLILLSGLLLFCTAVSADVCYEPYRLLNECSLYFPFITAPVAIQDIDEMAPSTSKIEQQLIDAAKFAPNASFSPQKGVEKFLARGRGSVQTQFGTSFSSGATSYRNYEVYRAHGLFDLSVSYGI